MDWLKDNLHWIFSGCGVAIIILIYTTLSRFIRRINKKFTWNDIEECVELITEKMKKEDFMPDLIYTPSTREAIVASMIAQRLRPSIPIYSGMLIHGLRKETESVITREGFDTEILTPMGYILIQKELVIKDIDKVLIIRDHSVSGRCFQTIIDYFGKKYNVRKENVRTACISYAKNTRDHAPSYSCLETNDIWFPWGKNL